MAEEQAIPDEVMREAERISGFANSALIEGPMISRIQSRKRLIELIAKGLITAELRGRTEQREADARIAETFDMNGLLSDTLPKGWPGCRRNIATAIRSQS